MDQIVCDHLKLDCGEADMTDWTALVEKVRTFKENKNWSCW